MAKGASALIRSRENRALVYMCECGKKWSEPPKVTSEGEGKRWKCNCGRALAMREGIIFQA